jgi:hypothetical protein
MAVGHIPRGLLPQYVIKGKSYYFVSDLEAYLLSRRETYLYTIRYEDGTSQMFSESLFIIFGKQSRHGQKNPCLHLVESVKPYMIASFLSRSNSVFQAYGNQQWQRNLSMNSHSFRHWLMHIAYKGGMETHLILRYFAKRYASDIVDYLHFSIAVSDAYAPDESNGERFYVPGQQFTGETLEEDDA